jgi:hypothetical protein
MFKWICLGVAVVFLSLVVWMINDIRLEVHRSTAVVRTTGESVNENLPAILEKSRQTTNALSNNLPEVVEKVRKSTDTISKNLPTMVERIDKTTEVLAELAEDIRQLKELAGVTTKERDKSLVAYGISVLKKIETSGGIIGLKKKTFGSGLKNTKPAAEWAVGARKEALFLALLVKSKKEMLTRLAKNKFGSNWYIQFPDKDPVPLLDWLRENHPESKDLG